LTSIAGLVEGSEIFGIIFGLEVASAIIGAFLGFLFGIPRSLQHAARQTASGAETKVEMNASTAKGLNDTNNANGANATRRFFATNTNLEDISDWITKIIVGLSLVQSMARSSSRTGTPTSGVECATRTWIAGDKPESAGS
jgi:hypothetical protein